MYLHFKDDKYISFETLFFTSNEIGPTRITSNKRSNKNLFKPIIIRIENSKLEGIFFVKSSL